MKLSEHSRNRLLNSFSRWEVPQEYCQPVRDYLVNGWDPGSFCDDYYCSFLESEDGECKEGYSDSTPTVVETPEGVETSLLESRASSSQEGGS